MIDRACISLNSKCNLRCVYCHFADKKNNENSAKNEFTTDEVKLICKNLEEYIIKQGLSSFKLGIVGAGEPLLSFAQLKVIVEYFWNNALKHIIKMYVITNGTLLNREFVSFFYEYKDIIELNVSLDGDKQINSELRGSYPKFDEYVKLFGHLPKINAVVTKEIIENQERVLNFFISEEFRMINFSRVFGTSNPLVIVTSQEYESFLQKAQALGIITRQNTKKTNYDCAKYGRLCGVGRTNVFITKTGVYPCGRFMDIESYKIADWNESLLGVEERISKYHPCPDGECYYEYHKVGI